MMGEYLSKRRLLKPYIMNSEQTSENIFAYTILEFSSVTY